MAAAGRRFRRRWDSQARRRVSRRVARQEDWGRGAYSCGARAIRLGFSELYSHCRRVSSVVCPPTEGAAVSLARAPRQRRSSKCSIFMSAFGRIGRSSAQIINSCRPSAASDASHRKSCRPSPASGAWPQIIYSCRPSAASDARWRKSYIHVGLRPHRTLVGANHIFMSACGRIRRQLSPIIYSCRPSAASEGLGASPLHHN